MSTSRKYFDHLISESFEDINNCEDVDLGEDDLKKGLVFRTEDVAMKSIQVWFEKHFVHCQR